MLNCCSECSGLFLPDAEINSDKDEELKFIRFRHYESIRYCSFHKQILTNKVKMCSSCMYIENVDKVKVTTWKCLVLKYCSILDF